MKRRQFLYGSAAAATAPWWPCTEAASQTSNPGFHLGSITYNLFRDSDLDTIIAMLQVAGFEGVELRTTHEHGVEPSLGAAERSSVRRRFEGSDVRLVAYGTTCEFHSPDPDERRRQVEIGKKFVDLAVDTGALGIKVRPNGFPQDVPRDVTIRRIGESLRELGSYGAHHGIGIWMEVHGRGTNNPPIAAAIMRAADHEGVGICWNSNDEDIVDGSVESSFQLLRPWIQHVHINELSKPYPWRELFTLLRRENYRGYTMAEVQESKETERFLNGYRALWTELCRPCEGGA